MIDDAEQLWTLESELTRPAGGAGPGGFCFQVKNNSVRTNMNPNMAIKNWRWKQLNLEMPECFKQFPFLHVHISGRDVRLHMTSSPQVKMDAL